MYQRIVTDNGIEGQWKKVSEIKNSSTRVVEVQLDQGKEYEFVVTAINKFGESFKEDDKIKKIVVSGGRYIPKIASNVTGTQTHNG